MYLNNRIKAAKIGYIMISILLCVLGIVLIAVPDFSVTLLCRLGGGIMVLFGLVKIVGYCSKDLYRLAILTGAAGFLLVLRPSESAQVVMILLGVTLITEGVLNLITILTAVKIIRHQLPEVIDAEYCQIDPNRKDM